MIPCSVPVHEGKRRCGRELPLVHVLGGKGGLKGGEGGREGEGQRRRGSFQIDQPSLHKGCRYKHDSHKHQMNTHISFHCIQPGHPIYALHSREYNTYAQHTHDFSADYK